MEKEIAELIWIYQKNNKTVDKTFIEETLKIMISHLNLEDYVLRRTTLISITNNLAIYNLFFRVIRTNIFRIKRYIKHVRNDFSNIESAIYLDYILVVKILRHEIEHANQYKLISKSNNFESLVLKNEFEMVTNFPKVISDETVTIFDACLKLINNKKKYYELYEYSPAERLAEINASLHSIDIANILNDELTSFIMLENYYKSLLSGYNVGSIDFKSNEPTKYYLDSIDINDNWSSILIMSKNLDSFEKIKFGLQTTPEALHDIYNNIQKLSLKINQYK